MDPITVTICAGTACTVMDDSRLLLLEEFLPERLRGRVKVKGARCLDYCHGDGALEAPYVKIGDEVMKRATVAKILEHLEARLA